MKVFITGISGFLGRHIAELCVKEGHEVFALLRNQKINNAHFPFDVTVCYGDLTNLESFEQYLNGVDIVVHCAADTNMTAIKNQKQEVVNIKGTLNLMFASKKVNIKKFIFISTANTIEPGNANHPGQESSKKATLKTELPYINTKIVAEKILLNEFEINKFPVVVLNPTFILGPNDFGMSSGKLIFKAIKKQIPFCPKGGKNIVDVRDVAQAAIKAFTHGRNGNNYLLSNENLSYRELFAISCGYAKVNAPKYNISTLLGFSIGVFGTSFETATKKSFAINHKTMKLSSQNHHYDSTKARLELGFNPRPAIVTLIDTVNWFQHEFKT